MSGLALGGVGLWVIIGLLTFDFWK